MRPSSSVSPIRRHVGTAILTVAGAILTALLGLGVETAWNSRVSSDTYANDLAKAALRAQLDSIRLDRATKIACEALRTVKPKTKRCAGGSAA